MRLLIAAVSLNKLFKPQLMYEMFVNAWREIRRRKNRSIGIISGYIIAVAFLVISLSFAGLSWLGTNAVLEYTGAQFIGFVYSSSPRDGDIAFRDPDHEGLFVYNNPTVLFPVTLVDAIRRSPNVKSASPLLTFTVITDDYVSRSWVLAGFDPADMESVRMASCSATDIIEGRLIEPEDTGVVLLEQTFADAEQYKIGEIIYLGDSEFTVAGILSPGTRPTKADIYMPLQEAVRVLNTRIEQPVMNVANVVLVDGSGALMNNRAISDVREILGFNSSTLGYGCFNPAGAAMSITVKGMRILGLIVFASVMILIVASQYYSVVERQNDIGILKAIGWSDRSVISQIMAESFIQSVIGGVAGSVAAIIVFVSLPVDYLLGIEGHSGLSLNLIIVTTGYILTVLAGTLAGVISAVTTLRLQPADILRRL